MYNGHFGFREGPFSLTPDAEYWYENGLYREAYATLRYGIEGRKGFVVISGEAGTGKTTLLRRLMQSLGDEVQTALIFNPQLGFVELLRAVMRDLGLEAGVDRLAMMSEFNGYLMEQMRCGRVVAVLIDEAQDLSVEVLEELRLLSNLETDKEKLLQMVLVGQPELERKLERAELRQFKQRVALRCRLEPLAAWEVGRYLDLRLRRAGYGGEGLFEEGAVEGVWRYSRGIPRLINVICDNALILAYAAGARRVTGAMIEQAALELKLGDKPEEKVESADPHPRSRPTASEWEKKPPPEGKAAPLPLRPRRKPPSSRWDEVARRVASLGVALMIAGSGLALYAHRDRLPLAALSGAFEGKKPTEQHSADSGPISMPERGETPAESSPAPASVALQPPLPEAQPESGSREAENLPQPETARPEPEPRFESKNSAAASLPAAEQDSRSSVSDERLKVEVYRAIHRRAIRGLLVSVENGTVYLDGEVASERQKRIAATAAALVPGVEEVHDRVVVSGAPLQPTRNDSSRQDLELAVTRAIHNRAIHGVQVSVVEGRVYLDGRVATHRQKNAAARAAHGVPGVKSVHDRIVVNPAQAPGGRSAEGASRAAAG